MKPYPCTSGSNNEEYQVVIGNDTTSYIIDDLESARNYSFYIVAYMPMGASRMSDQVTQHTLEDGKDRTHRDGRLLLFCSLATRSWIQQIQAGSCSVEHVGDGVLHSPQCL